MFPSLMELAAATLHACDPCITALHPITQMFSQISSETLQTIDIKRPPTDLNISNSLRIDSLAYGVGCFVCVNDHLTYIFPYADCCGQTVTNMLDEDDYMLVSIYVDTANISVPELLANPRLQLFPILEATSMTHKSTTTLISSQHKMGKVRKMEDDRWRILLLLRSQHIIPDSQCFISDSDHSLSSVLHDSKYGDDV